MKKTLLRWARGVTRRLGCDLVPYFGQFPPDFEPEICDTAERVTPYTMTSPERIYALCKAVEHIVRRQIPGAIVECGVWKGGSMMAVALTLLRLGDRDRKLYLFDTFEGMTPPQDIDADFRGGRAADLLRRGAKGKDWIWGAASLDDVAANLRLTGYDERHVTFVKGPVEETIPDSAPDQIALLRLDTDWYESTRHELEHLYPCLAPGGALIIDDYGHWQGARRAVDEYIERHNLPLHLCRIDYTGRIAIKPH